MVSWVTSQTCTTFEGLSYFQASQHEQCSFLSVMTLLLGRFFSFSRLVGFPRNGLVGPESLTLQKTKNGISNFVARNVGVQNRWEPNLITNFFRNDTNRPRWRYSFDPFWAWGCLYRGTSPLGSGAFHISLPQAMLEPQVLQETRYVVPWVGLAPKPVDMTDMRAKRFRHAGRPACPCV